MAKRKKQFISDDDLDSSSADSDGDQDEGLLVDFDDEDPEERAERLRARGKRRRKRPGYDAKEEALYGVWAQQDEDRHDVGRRNGSSRHGGTSKSLQRTPAFVPSSRSAESSKLPHSDIHKDQDSTSVPTDLANAVPLPGSSHVQGASSIDGPYGRSSHAHPEQASGTDEGRAASSNEAESGADGSSSSSSILATSDDDSDSDKEDETSRRRIPRNREAEQEEADDLEDQAAKAKTKNGMSSNADTLRQALLEVSKQAEGSAEADGRGLADPSHPGLGKSTNRGGIGSLSRGMAATANTTAGSSACAASPVAPAPNLAAPHGHQQPPPPPAPRERRSFLTGGLATESLRTPGVSENSKQQTVPAISKTEKRHFDRLASQGGVGYKLLAKMGWQAGTGLGTSGEGIVTPIESKLRPKAMGLAYEGFTERTKQSKEEEKRRRHAAGTPDRTDDGESEDDDDDRLHPLRRGRGGKGKRADRNGALSGVSQIEGTLSGSKKGDRAAAWKQSKPRKPKVKHMTYEQIVGGTDDVGDYDNLVDRSSQAHSHSNGPALGVITDLTGREMSAAALSNNATTTVRGEGRGGSHTVDVPTNDARRLPELRYNLTIISDSTKSDLDNLAREAKNVRERRAWLVNEEQRIQRVAREHDAKIERLEIIVEATGRVQQLALEVTPYDVRSPGEQMAAFAESFEQLLDSATPDEYEAYRLDDIVVGALTPTLKRAWLAWRPLDEPTAYLDDLKRYSKMFRLRTEQADSGGGPNTYKDYSSATSAFVPNDEGLGGSVTAATQPRSQPQKRAAGQRPASTMTSFESMLWTSWLPRVRSAINNEWSPTQPDPAIQLYSRWSGSGLLSRFMRDNILDQLILPKVSKAIADWRPPRHGGDSSKKKSPQQHRHMSSDHCSDEGVLLHHIVFPWLEYAGDERMEGIIDEAKRRVRGWLKSWRTRDGVPDGLDAWRSVIPAKEWDNLILQFIVPQLSAHLRDKFTVNPRQQDLEPLRVVLAWQPLLRPSILSQILETEFFPKYLSTLYTWLTSTSADYGQIAEWYTYWKRDVFAAARTTSGNAGVGVSADTLPGVERGFARALDLMNQARALGEDVKYRLKRPELPSTNPAAVPSLRGTLQSTSSRLSAVDSATVGALDADKQQERLDISSRGAEITFRAVVEEVAADNNLLFMATGRSHEGSGLPLFRVSSGIDGKSGVTVYLQGDVIYAMEGTSSKPISVQTMVERASRT